MIIGEKNTDLKRLTGQLKLHFLTEIGRFHWNQGKKVAHFAWFGEPCKWTKTWKEASMEGPLIKIRSSFWQRWLQQFFCFVIRSVLIVNGRSMILLCCCIIISISPFM